MTDRLDVAIKIVEETCPQRRLKLENIKSFPEIIRKAPLTYIASYLQMSLETLSRVRSSISTQP